MQTMTMMNSMLMTTEIPSIVARVKLIIVDVEPMLIVNNTRAHTIIIVVRNLETFWGKTEDYTVALSYTNLYSLCLQ